MLYRISVLIVLVLTCAGAIIAQDQVQGPLMGFVLDRAEGARPVLGIPGAATLGRSTFSTAGLDNVVLDPGARFALATSGPKRAVVLLRNDTKNRGPFRLGLRAGGNRITLSPSGDSAAVYYQDDQYITVLTGLPDAVSISWRLSLRDLDDTFSTFAVSDDGAVVLAVTAGEQAHLCVLTPETGLQLLPSIAKPSGIAFFHNSRDAVVIDGVLKSVMILVDPAGDLKLTNIGGKPEGKPVSVAVAADNDRVFVANKEPGGVVSISLSGAEAAVTPCDCAPALMESIGLHSAFRLNDPGEGVVWLFDGYSSPPQIYFVPEQPKKMPTGREPVVGRRNRSVE
jgi:hypothetical protein